jgi:hypothetical protein
MVNDIIDAYLQCGARVNPSLLNATSGLPRFLVPPATAKLVRHRARSQPPNLSAIIPALVVDDDGAVLIHAIEHGSQTSTAPLAFTVGAALSPGIRKVEEITPRPVTCLVAARVVVFQQIHVTDCPSFFWCEGECGVGAASLTSAGWLLPVDVRSDIERVTMLDPQSGSLMSLGQLLRGSVAAAMEDEVVQSVMQDMGTAIGTAIEQLDHIGRGCSLREVSRGLLVLPE